MRVSMTVPMMDMFVLGYDDSVVVLVMFLAAVRVLLLPHLGQDAVVLVGHIVGDRREQRSR